MKEKFREIFTGLQTAYGQYQKGERSENGKQKGKAFIVRKQITDNLWEDHLNGIDPALGIIPINEDNNCKWGCFTYINNNKFNINTYFSFVCFSIHRFQYNNINICSFCIIIFSNINTH